MTGIFVSLEGPEGGGKSTQAARLAQRLRSLGHEVVAVREPGGTPIGESIRGLLQREGEPIQPETEALLFAASRAQLVRCLVRPALERGACVICDRFADSTTAYQGYGRGLGLDFIRELNRFAVDGAWPDLTVLLDVETGIGVNRIAERNLRDNARHDRIENEERSFHERVRQGFLLLAARSPDRFRVVDASRDADAVEVAVWSLVSGLLSPRAAGMA
jgi:dTMP kinase